MAQADACTAHYRRPDLPRDLRKPNGETRLCDDEEPYGSHPVTHRTGAQGRAEDWYPNRLQPGIA